MKTGPAVWGRARRVWIPHVTYSYETFLKQFGAKLRAMRIERGWTLRDMIVLHGYHLAQWQNFEKGKGMSVPSLFRLCEVFDVSFFKLLDDLGLGDEGTAPDAAQEKPARVAARKAAAKSPAKRSVRSRVSG